MSKYHHLAHLKYPPIPKDGAWVKRGDLIGFVGNTGASSGAHLHYEIRLSAPPSWASYVNGWSKLKVKATYENPASYIKKGIPCDFTYPGSKYLEWNGSVFHPGVDMNSPNDEGKPVYSPCEGRVRHSKGISAMEVLARKILPRFFNSGWGNHIWIEEAPSYKIP